MFEFDDDDFIGIGIEIEEATDPLYGGSSDYQKYNGSDPQFPQDGLGCALLLLIAFVSTACLTFVLLMNVIH